MYCGRVSCVCVCVLDSSKSRSFFLFHTIKENVSRTIELYSERKQTAKFQMARTHAKKKTRRIYALHYAFWKMSRFPPGRRKPRAEKRPSSGYGRRAVRWGENFGHAFPSAVGTHAQ